MSIVSQVQPTNPNCHTVKSHLRRGGRDLRWIAVAAYLRCRAIIQVISNDDAAVPTPSAQRICIMLDRGEGEPG